MGGQDVHVIAQVLAGNMPHVHTCSYPSDLTELAMTTIWFTVSKEQAIES